MPPPEPGKVDLWPGYLGSFIRTHPHADVGDEAVQQLEALNGLFGLVLHWSTDTKITKHTYNARSETVAEKPSFRDAWKLGQRCIIPADSVFSYTMLTINADQHPLMNQFHKPTDEKRMVVILEPERYQDWLEPKHNALDFMRPHPADLLQASAPTPINGVLFL
jgi:putative SOS response-associated peptidase YedK